jgi:uncharacterized phosphosugar-binding protein
MTPAESPSLADAYLTHLRTLIERFRLAQRAALAQAATLIAERLRHGGVIHLFGTGHSHMIAEEVFYRAGGLIPIDAMLDASVVLSGGATRSTETERTPGAAAAIAARYNLRAGDAGVVISHSGRNPAPVEMAVLMRQAGLAVIAVTSLTHSRALPPHTPPGARLFEVADVVLDTGGAYGDAALELPGALHPVGPTSTVVAAAIVQALLLAAMERLAAGGHPVVNFPSGNAAPGDLAALLAEVAKYRDRIRHL